VYGNFEPWKEFAAGLRERAERAWTWYRTHPRSYDCDSGEIKAGLANLNQVEQDRAEAVAAMHLWALTAKPEYQEAFNKQIGSLRQLAEDVWSPYQMGAAEALLEYRTLPGADLATCERIGGALTRSLTSKQFMPQNGAGELYRAWMPKSCYHWGSNQIRACQGIVAEAAVTYGLAGARRDRLRQRALDMLHALHGVNPLDLVNLTNMGRCGAEVSARHLFHEWFRHEPPPGYVVGGPNQSYSGELTWLKHQPPAKSYADFNDGWPANSWEFSEMGIYYEACYIRLLADFVPAGSPAGPGSSGKNN
jgi:hypothetical protein